MHAPAPGTVDRPARFRPRLRYELVDCGVHGHALVGMDVRQVREQDGLVVREAGGLRWYRCLRCDSWLPLPAPDAPTRDHLPAPDEIELPLRGRPLRDRYVLRLIALDRIVHVLLLAAAVVLIIVFADRREQLKPVIDNIVNAVEGGQAHDTGHGLVHELRRLFVIDRSSLLATAAAVAAYGILEGVEAVGLWLAKRWAEYLTLLATALFLPVEVYELVHTVSPLKLVTFLINLAIVVYLLFAKRLFGIRGGGKAEERARERDMGWPAIERATPRSAIPAAAADPSPGETVPSESEQSEPQGAQS